MRTTHTIHANPHGPCHPPSDPVQVLAFLNKLQDVVAEYTTAAEVQQAAAAAL